LIQLCLSTLARFPALGAAQHEHRLFGEHVRLRRRQLAVAHMASGPTVMTRSIVMFWLAHNSRKSAMVQQWMLGFSHQRPARPGARPRNSRPSRARQ
jgi:hypothetical protein